MLADEQHFVLGCAWMYLYDNWAYNVENTLAVNVARRLACAVRTVSATYQITDMDTFVAMCWTFVSRMLVREVKRLNSLGRSGGTSTRTRGDTPRLTTRCRSQADRGRNRVDHGGVTRHRQEVRHGVVPGVAHPAIPWQLARRTAVYAGGHLPRRGRRFRLAVLGATCENESHPAVGSIARAT